MGPITLQSSTIGLSEANVIASVAIDRETPVAVSTLDAKTIQEQLGDKELVETLNITPGVYATKSGGGFGDSRINIRGFDQRNVAVLINGIPVNDMENGWVYWSNWAGLGDAVNTMQVQRGLGASKLAINSVGGTLNIITKATDMKKGGSLMQSGSVAKLPHGIGKIHIVIGISRIEIIDPFPGFVGAVRKTKTRESMDDRTLHQNGNICLGGIIAHQLRLSSPHRFQKTG